MSELERETNPVIALYLDYRPSERPGTESALLAVATLASGAEVPYVVHCQADLDYWMRSSDALSDERTTVTSEAAVQAWQALLTSCDEHPARSPRRLPPG